MPRCPSCFSPLTRVEEDEIKSSTCGNCFGTWINNVALLRRTRLDLANVTKPAEPGAEEKPMARDDIRSASLADLAEVVQASDSKAMLRCPQCEKFMVKDRFHPMIPVHIDRCKHCSSIWLDAGELTLIRRLYVELMSSTDAEIQHRRDKVATVTAAWEGRKTAADELKESLSPADSKGETGFDLLKHLLRS